jgi:Tfp pilus assembly protein PilF
MNARYILITIAALLVILIGTSGVIAQSFNEMPMYGGINKNEKMKKADADLIAAIEKAGYSRQSGSQDAVRKGWLYFEKGDLSTAMKRFNQAWLLDPENGDVYHGFALIVHQRDNAISEAEKYFKMALSKSRVSVNAYVDYGRFLWAQNRYDESLIQLDKAIEISPKVYNARSNISFVYFKKGDFIQACKWAKAAKDNNDQLESGYLEAMCRRASNY